MDFGILLQFLISVNHQPVYFLCFQLDEGPISLDGLPLSDLQASNTFNTLVPVHYVVYFSCALAQSLKEHKLFVLCCTHESFCTLPFVSIAIPFTGRVFRCDVNASLCKTQKGNG